jgi:hypothetical protein
MLKMTRKEAETYAKAHCYKPLPAVLEGLRRGLRGKRLQDFVTGWYRSRRKSMWTASKSTYGLGRRNCGSLSDN